MSKSVYGIDLAKHSFSIHGEDHQGKVLIHRTILRQSVVGEAGAVCMSCLSSVLLSPWCDARQTLFVGSMYGPPRFCNYNFNGSGLR